MNKYIIKMILMIFGVFLFLFSSNSMAQLENLLSIDSKQQINTAPDRPKLTAVPGDGRVTLFWDESAESSVDSLLGLDFEGYKIYRSTERDFMEMKQVTNAFGEVKYRRRLEQFDIKDNKIEGLSAGLVEGSQFDLGYNTGLVHKWIDSTVVNGQQYYYLLTSYDRGSDSLLIPPAECDFELQVEPVSGEVISKSSNIGIVTPNAPSPGYLAATSDVAIEHVQGYSGSSLAIEVLDSPSIKDNNTYRVTFKDTVLGYGQGSSLVTKSFTFANETTGDTLLLNSTKVQTGIEHPIFEGFRLVMTNHDEVKVDTLKTKFNREGIYEPVFKSFFLSGVGCIRPADYRIVFGEVGVDTSTVFKLKNKNLPAKPVNFTITNITENTKIDFAISEWVFAADSTKGILNGGKWKDDVYFLEKNENGDLITTWHLTLATGTADDLNPAIGDTLYLYTIRPFLSNDIYEFTTIGEKCDVTAAKAEIDRIRVVPNPYVVTNTWESANAYSAGRGPRELHFTHLPAKCTIHIFDIAGQLVDVIKRNGTMNDGTEVWDMLSKDQMEIGYGIYIYHIDAGEIGQKTGKFAVIK